MRSVGSRTITAARLASHIGFWMRRVSNGVSHAFARKLAASGVTVAEWVVLREMCGGDHPTSASAVAARTGLTRGAVSKLITRLFAKGLVTRREASRDRRYEDLALTPAARRLMPKLVRLADQNDAAFFGALSEAERQHLKVLLRKIAALHQLTEMPID